MTRRFASLAAAPLLVALAACGGEAETPETEAVPVESAAPAAPAPVPAADGAMLDPNAATAEELRTVPGIDAALADALVAGRPYADMTAVDARLASLGEEQRDSVYTRLWIPIDLNSATREEILLIPGVGDRMAHEFEEYRPYRGIEQFRREIGKYVDEAEVARLERYVTIR